MALHPEIVIIDDPAHVESVLDAMNGFAERGQGWVNVQPEISPDAVRPTRSGLTQYFRRNSPDAALGTWMAPPAGGAEANLGLQHALGERIGPHLDGWNLALREGWRRVQDSPRRGLLVSVPASESLEVVLGWLLDVTSLATRPETTGHWTVSLYPGRS